MRAAISRTTSACGLAVIVSCFALFPAKADTIIGTEDPQSGLVSDFLGTGYLVASDGEASFDPFGAGYDTSDGINFSAITFPWYQASDSHWTSLGNQIWVLPADLSAIGCGVETGTSCEPVGHFYSPSGWVPSVLGWYTILDPNGAVSDRIYLYNDPSSQANVQFYSDPVPEPGTIAIFVMGLLALGLMLGKRRRRNNRSTA